MSGVALLGAVLLSLAVIIGMVGIFVDPIKIAVDKNHLGYRQTLRWQRRFDRLRYTGAILALAGIGLIASFVIG